MQKHLITFGLAAIALVSATYTFWPVEEPSGEMKVDPAKKAAGLSGLMISKLSFTQDTKLDGSTVINGHEVPPMPHSAENNKTVAGVDTDHNGIRDDIDREIALIPWHNDVEFKAAQDYMRSSQATLVNPTPENVKATWKSLACVPGKSFPEQSWVLHRFDELERKIINTPERARIDNKAFSGTVAGECSTYN